MDYFSLDFVRYGVYSELSPIELERQSKDKDSQCYSTLNDPEFLVVLAEKWSLESCKSFEEFMLVWLHEYIFSPEIPLEYILANYKRVYSTPKAVRVATRAKRDDFCDYFPHNENIRLNILLGGLRRPEILAEYYEYRYKVLRKAYRHNLMEHKPLRDDILENTCLRIILRQPVITGEIVNVLDIARMTKDLLVLEDPYYLNHPNVSLERPVNFSHYYLEVRILEHFKITKDDLLKVGEQFVHATRKLCDYYDKIGYSNMIYVCACDLYSLEWIERKALEQGLEVVVEEQIRPYGQDWYKYKLFIKKDGVQITDSYPYYTSHRSPVDMLEWLIERSVLEKH